MEAGRLGGGAGLRHAGTAASEVAARTVWGREESATTWRPCKGRGGGKGVDEEVRTCR